MNTALPTGPLHRYVKPVDLAEFAEIATIIATIGKPTFIVRTPPFAISRDIGQPERVEVISVRDGRFS
jgi:hypothetical protein